MKSKLAAQIAQKPSSKSEGKRKILTSDLTQEVLRSILRHDPKTGRFHWRQSRPGVRKDSVAGSIDDKGYRVIRINRVLYKAHRLVWLYYHGTSPEIIDHINHDREDNRLENLRAATISENNANTDLRSDNSTGFKGVSYHKGSGRYIAKLCGKTLGYFRSPEEAARKYTEAATEKFGVHFNDTTGQKDRKRYS